MKSITLIFRVFLAVLIAASGPSLGFAGDDKDVPAVRPGVGALDVRGMSDEELLRQVQPFLRNRQAEFDAGKIDPDSILFREEFKEFIASVLRREDMNNAVVTGDRGVGKSAAVMSLLRMLSELGHSLYETDLGTMQGNTEMRGALENRVALFIEFFRRNPKAVAFIDEFHQVVQNETMRELIKPALSSGEITVIAATTYEEWVELVEPHAALASRFLEYELQELKRDEAVEVLQSYAPKVEAKNATADGEQLLFMPTSFDLLIDLVQRFMAGESLMRTSKAILNMAAARVSVARDRGSSSAAISDDAELKALIKNRDYLKANFEKLEDRVRPEQKIRFLKQIADKNEAIKIIEARQLEREKLVETKEIREQRIYELPELIKEAQMQGDLGLAAKLSVELEQHRASSTNAMAEDDLGERNYVDDIDIYYAVSQQSGIDMDLLMNSDPQSVVKRLEDRLQVVEGMEDAKIAILEAEKIRATGMDPTADTRPSVIYLTGQKGGGKTYIFQQMAYARYGQEDAPAFLISDGSQAQQGHAIGNWIGSPRGYVGFGKEGEVTGWARRNPTGLWLIDEFRYLSKEHQNLLMLVLDKGWIKDLSTGRKVDFSGITIGITDNSGEIYLGHRRGSQERRDYEKDYLDRNWISQQEYDDLEVMTPYDREVFMLKKILEYESKMSQALIDRIGTMVAVGQMKRSQYLRITQRRLQDFAAYVYRKHLYEVSFQPDLAEQLTKLFFRPGESGRLAQTSVKKVFSKLFAEAAIAKALKIGKKYEVVMDFNEVKSEQTDQMESEVTFQIVEVDGDKRTVVQSSDAMKDIERDVGREKRERAEALEGRTPVQVNQDTEIVGLIQQGASVQQLTESYGAEAMQRVKMLYGDLAQVELEEGEADLLQLGSVTNPYDYTPPDGYVLLNNYSEDSVKQIFKKSGEKLAYQMYDAEVKANYLVPAALVEGYKTKEQEAAEFLERYNNTCTRIFMSEDQAVEGMMKELGIQKTGDSQFTLQPDPNGGGAKL